MAVKSGHSGYYKSRDLTAGSGRRSPSKFLTRELPNFPDVRSGPFDKGIGHKLEHLANSTYGLSKQKIAQNNKDGFLGRHSLLWILGIIGGVADFPQQLHWHVPLT